jgi:Leucine-rich repeat (LRR) protein
MDKLELFHVYGGLQVVRNQTFTPFRNSSILELSLKTEVSLYHLEPDSFSNFSKLETPITLMLEVNENGVTCPAPDFFKFSAQRGCVIQRFLLSGNNLATQFELDVDGLTFRHFGNTKELDITRNGIKSLPTKVFRHTVGLQKLNLSQNSLRIFEFQLDHMARLVELDLSYNLVATLDQAVTDNLASVFRSVKPNANLSIDLTGNSLQCSCETLPFLHWASSHRQLYLLVQQNLRHV